MTSKCRREPTKCDRSSVVYVHLIKQTVHVQVRDERISTLKNMAKFCLVHSSITIHVKRLEKKVNWEQKWIICILSLYTVTYLPTSNNQRLRSAGTLGARDFSGAVSGFCQVFIVWPARRLRRSWLRPSANTENSRRTREPPLVTRVECGRQRSVTCDQAFFTLLLHRSALREFHVTDSQNTRDQITRDRMSKGECQIAFCLFHSFLVEVQTNAGYIHATHA